MVDFILHQKPEMQGYIGILSLFNHFIYDTDISAKQYLPVDIIVKENLHSYLNEKNRMFDFMV